MLLYSAVLLFALLLAAPWWLFRMATTQRYREGLLQRLGRVPASLRELVAGKRTVWLHAVSVGEVLAASTLISALSEELGPGWLIVISTTTRAGQQLARQRFGAERVFYFPLDFRFAVCAWLGVIRPEMLLLVESELWPRLLHQCEHARIPVVVVNARISDRTLRRGLRVRRLRRWMARHVTLWLAQSEQDAIRILQLGALPAAVQVTGNLKYDTRPAQDTALASAIRSGAAGRTVVVAGSTVHYGTTLEAEIVLEAFQSHIWPEMPGVLLVLAPRHPQSFVEAGVLAARFGTRLCATELLRMPPGYRIQERTLVLDTIGDLAGLYRMASVAFVGGSLLSHGGHNPLEPAQFGVPVVIGPYYENFRDIVARLQAADGIVVLERTDPGALGHALAGLLLEPSRGLLVGERGRAVAEQQKGATARTVAALLPLLHREEDGPATDTRVQRP